MIIIYLMSPLRRGFPLRRLDDNQDEQETRSVYHLSTKTENSGWKFKWCSSFHEIVSEKDGNSRHIPLFPFQPK